MGADRLVRLNRSSAADGGSISQLSEGMAMARISALLLAFTAGRIGLVSAGDDKELAKFDGTWVMVSATVDGKELTADELKHVTFVIKSGKSTQMFKDKERGTASFKVYASKKPAEMDFTFEDGPLKGTTLKGVYKFDGDKLVVCRGGVGKDRPTAFESKAGSGNILQTLVKRKAEQ
jgi:uncharacterized protein (TIGR03067 family)